MEKDIYMGLDKGIVRSVINLGGYVTGDDFMTMPLPVKIIKESEKVKVYAQMLDGSSMTIEIDEEQEKFLIENEDGIIDAVLIKLNDEFMVNAVVGNENEREELEELLEDIIVESFIEFKGFTTKDELEDYVHNVMIKLEQDIEEPVDINNLDIEARRELGVNFLFEKAVCPICSGIDIIKIDKTNVDKELYAHLYGCPDCGNMFCVSSNEYGTVLDFGIIESHPSNTNQKKKKKKKKKTKKTFGKRKK